MTQDISATPRALQARLSGHADLGVALLQQVFAPDSVVVVGANRLHPLWLGWEGLDAARTLLVDAQRERLQAVQLHLPHTRGWPVRDALLDAADGTAAFHTLSHASESGLLPGQALQALWPNMRTASTEERPTCRLDTLLANDAALAKVNEGKAGWLIIDCLPAVRVLQGALQRVQQCRVVGVRVLVGDADTSGASGANIDGASLEEAKAVLEPLGLRHAFNLDETHPAIVMAMFIREAETGLNEEAVRQIDALNAAKTGLATELDAARKAAAEALAARDAEAKAKADALAARDAEAKAKTEALAARDAEAKAKVDAAAARDAEAKSKTDAVAARDTLLEQVKTKDAQIDALSKEKAGLATELDAARKAAAEALAARDAEAKAKTEALAARDAEAKAKTEALAARDAEAKAKTEALGRLPELEARIAALIEERSDLTHAWEADVQAKTQALEAREAEAKATAEALKARDAALAQLQQKEARIAELTKEKTELAAARDAQEKAGADALAERDAALEAKDAATATIATLTRERDQARKQHADQSARMEQLEADNAQAHHRQQLMQDELIKAEAQIELIKDLLLREQGL